MGGTFDLVSEMMFPGLVRGFPLERSGSEFLVHARCWVLRGRALIAQSLWLGGWWLFLWGLSCCHRWVVGGGGTARTLRTTQWTRASSMSSFWGWCREDDLKDH